MTSAIDKVVRVERILMGTRPLRITLSVGTSHSLEEFLLDNHETIFPGFRHKAPQRLFHSWNNLTSDNVSLFEHTQPNWVKEALAKGKTLEEFLNQQPETAAKEPEREVFHV